MYAISPAINRLFKSRLLNPLVFLSGLLIAANANAELILTAPPRESASLAKAMYDPIAERLSTLIGERVVYQRPSNWFDYASRMRKNQYDIVFDGPHLTAWRLKHLNHHTVASLPGKLRFVLVADKANKDIHKLHDLVGHKICGILSPNLGTDLIIAQFTNPAVQPVIYSITGDMLEVYRSFTEEKKCSAAILRDKAYATLPEQERNALKVIFRTKPMPNQAITISPKLEQHKKKLREFMTSTDGADSAAKLLSRYSKEARYFIPALAKTYHGAEDLIEGVVYGW